MPPRPISKTLRHFMENLENPDRYDNIDFDTSDEGEYLMVVDEGLGLSLIHAGVYPDYGHYRHKIYIVVGNHGRAIGRVAQAGSVVASVLSAQYTTRQELCKALRSSIEKNGLRIIARHPDSSRSRCPSCGHDSRFWTYLYESHFFSADEYRETSCCNLYSTCCNCQGGAMLPVNTSFDQPSDDTPKTYPIGKFDESTTVPMLPPPPTDGWQAITPAVPFIGEPFATTQYYYYQNIQQQRNYYTNTEHDVDGYAIEGATPRQALLEQDGSGRFEDITGQVDKLAIEDYPAAV